MVLNVQAKKNAIAHKVFTEACEYIPFKRLFQNFHENTYRVQMFATDYCTFYYVFMAWGIKRRTKMESFENPYFCGCIRRYRIAVSVKLREKVFIIIMNLKMSHF